MNSGCFGVTATYGFTRYSETQNITIHEIAQGTTVRSLKMNPIGLILVGLIDAKNKMAV